MTTQDITKNSRIAYKGISRAVSDQLVEDGYLDEMINLRPRDGKLRTIGSPTKLYNLPSGTYNKIWIHEQDGIQNYIGQNSANELHLINMATGLSTLIKAYSEVIQVTFLKKFLLVVHATGIDRFLWKDGEYNLIVMPLAPEFYLAASSSQEYSCEKATTAVGVLGKYYKKVNELSRDEGKLTGGMMYRAAYRMYDGSYVMHTVPKYIELGTKMTMREEGVDGEGDINDNRFVKFYASPVHMVTYPVNFLNIDTDIFTHLVVFACKNESLYEFNEETFDDDVMLNKVSANSGGENNFDVDFKDIFDNVNPAFKEMADNESWYKVIEVDMKELQVQNDTFNTFGYVKALDMKDYYQDYATRETMPVDQFSHHSITGAFAYNYNSRLILANTNNKFGDYPFLWDTLLKFPAVGYTIEAQLRKTYLLYTIKTDTGTIQKLSNYFFHQYVTKNGVSATTKYFMIPRVIGYPDARCTKIEVIVEDGGVNYLVKSFDTKKATFGNYAYYHSENFTNYDPADELSSNYNYQVLNFTFDPANIVNLYLYTSDNSSDENRIQISELNNPFVFPAENSYRVGTGRAMCCATNTEPLSSGQFGEYPLIVFTTKGIWTLLQGQGDVLFSNVKPLNGEVPENIGQIISTGTGVTYFTSRGLFLITGTQVTMLSQLLHGSPNYDLQAVTDYTWRLNQTNLVQIGGKLSDVDALVYIAGAKIGFDKKNNELLVTNSSKPYSYVYSFESNVWFKRSESFRVLINSYPDLLVLRENTPETGVFSLSSETFVTTVPVLLTTRPIKIDGNASFILIHRAIQRCEIITKASTYAGFYLFGSNDLKTWQLLQGSDRKTGTIVDIFCTRSHLKLKYFIFVFAGDLQAQSAINHVDLQYYYKLNNKIR